MLETFVPRLDALPESQRLFWPELDAVPSDFVLYGGTGLTLQLGHRVSEDFDFFSSVGFGPDRLQARLPFFRDLDPVDTEGWVHRKRNNLEAFVDRAAAPSRSLSLAVRTRYSGLRTHGSRRARACWWPR
jgi:hypothetical protein